MSQQTELAHRSVDERLQHLANNLRGDEQVNVKDLPGLADLLNDHISPEVEVSHEDFVRRLLRVFKDSKTDGTFSNVLSNYDAEECDRLHNFVSGKPASEAGQDFDMGLSVGAREELRLSRSIGEKVEGALVGVETLFKQGHQGGLPDELKDLESKQKLGFFVDKAFKNWGQTVENTPKITCVPKSSDAVQAVVKYAKEHDMNVRASGYRHSWSPVFARNGQILISMLDLDTATKLPNTLSLPGSGLFDRPTDLDSINFVGEPEKGKQRLVRVGCATTNQQLRRWCLEQQIDHQSSLPLNVIMVEITLGGSNAPICHGAGRRHRSLSDLVHAIEYIDVNGVLQTIDKSQPEFLSAASGCFGLLGIVTHITLTLDPMSYAYMMPQKLPVMMAIPPPPDMKDEDIPPTLRMNMTPEQRSKAQADFEQHATSDFYAEWFWFPYTSEVWVNCWNTVDDPKGAVNFPSDPQVFLQFAETVAIQVLQSAEVIVGAEKIAPLLQTTLISTLGLAAMPNVTDASQAIKTQLPNALHFRRAIQNVRVRDMEMEIPLQPKTKSTNSVSAASDTAPEIDYSYVQKAWWSAILTAYRHTDKCPQRMPLELRITGDSSVVMAPFRGNDLGTCSIEVLTLESEKDLWLPYAQEVLDQWMSLKGADGKYLKSRPHWAKEWYPFTVRGMKMTEYLKNDVYREEIKEFRNILKKIGEKQGWRMDDLQSRFSNDLWDSLIYDTTPETNSTITQKNDSQSTSLIRPKPGQGSLKRWLNWLNCFGARH